MGKASRLKREKLTKGNLVFPGFPYSREFTKAELDVIFARWERLKETLRDAVGPQGWGLGLSEDFLQQLALHQALAGVDVDPAYPAETAFIRPVRNPDGLHVDSLKWVLTKNDKPGDRARDAKAEARARFKALREKAMQDAPEDVRDAMRELMLEGSEWAQDQAEPDLDEAGHPVAEPAADLTERSDQ